ncbi:MAG: hypothetical protein Alis3KO_36020 [Aliiglaciecola sp.]
MESKFLVDGKTFKVVFSKLGFEKYYYDEKLLKSRWSFKFIDTLSFQINENLVEIKVNVYPKTFSTQAYVNGELVVEELLPEMKKQVEEGKKISKRDKKKNAQLLIVWFVFMMMFLVYFQW